MKTKNNYSEMTDLQLYNLFCDILGEEEAYQAVKDAKKVYSLIKKEDVLFNKFPSDLGDGW